MRLALRVSFRHGRLLARRTALDQHLHSSGDVPVKRYCYALRPALAIRALRLDPETRPPMNLQALVAAAAVPGSIAQDMAALVEAKSRTRERANATRLLELDALIRYELAGAPELPTRGGIADARDRADKLFLELVNQ